MIFDLDDTLLDRNQAVDDMFLFTLENCYGNVEEDVKKEMLRKFKEYDKRSYGISDKTTVFEALFDEFPPINRLPQHEIQSFWNEHFPQCFSINEHTIKIVKAIKEHMKVAIITNGTTQRQKAKIRNTRLHECFEIIMISEEAGYTKPDKRIFDLTLDKLQVQSEEALFVGDDLEKDIRGSQGANLLGIWFNPDGIQNETDIKPYDEISSLDGLLTYLTPEVLS
ncbi:HAD family hydrolase [Rossellomorea sp. NPDC077527]|uniref:HAD family hydrolase n=1 Tax=Rossellomorea sp. NPDC077527 TaxID=3364510 RepID=UPI0037CB9A20